MGNFSSAAARGAMALSGALLGALAYADPAPWDGPFGVQMGLSREEIGAVVELTPQYGVPNEYSAKTAPRPNQGFVNYVYQIAPGAGLCRVRSETPYGPRKATDRSFEAFYQRLTRKYGKPSAETENKSAVWAKGALPKDVRSITLAVATTFTAGSAVQLSYRFRNSSSCERPPVVDGRAL
jgi:hypothetical protein